MVTSKGCYQVRVLMLKAKIRLKTTKSSHGKNVTGSDVRRTTTHFGKGWADEIKIFTVASLYPVLIICIKMVQILQ